MKYRFDCIFYYVSDIERSIAFYCSILGMKLIDHDIIARLDIDGILVELIPVPPDEQLSGKGNARLCLRVDSMSDAARDLRKKDIAVSTILDKGTGFLANLEDPDGNKICLWQYRQ